MKFLDLTYRFLLFGMSFFFLKSCIPETKEPLRVEEAFIYDYAGYCSVYQNSKFIKPYIYAQVDSNDSGYIHIAIDQYWTEDSPYRNVSLGLLRIPAKVGYYKFSDSTPLALLNTFIHGFDIIEANFKIKKDASNYVNLTEITNNSIKGFFHVSFEQDTTRRKNMPLLGETVIYEDGFFQCVLH
ncbi:MAG TPA: hypothetical protein PLY70_06690 [Saprospiraceae bacterium]|nr:hypothetical protein [Saprospiraceae bacterium]HPN67908.1 hypothetical protein [Saprospiraceae bacterium]